MSFAHFAHFEICHMMHHQLVYTFGDAPGSLIFQAVAGWDLQLACSKNPAKKAKLNFQPPPK